MNDSEEVVSAQIKQDGKPYGVLVRVGVRPRLLRVTDFGGGS